jgi:hypothetical protein
MLCKLFLGADLPLWQKRAQRLLQLYKIMCAKKFTAQNQRSGSRRTECAAMKEITQQQTSHLNKLNFTPRSHREILHRSQPPKCFCSVRMQNLIVSPHAPLR